MYRKQSFQIMSLLSFLLVNEVSAQWLPTGGPSNDWITCLKVVDTRLFVGTVSGNIFVSANNGTNWLEADSGLTNTHIWTIFSAGANLFAATDSGVFVSIDNAAHWSKIGNGLPKSIVYSLASRSTNLFAGTDRGVYVSSNSGSNWVEADTGLTYRRVFSLATSGTNIIAGTGGGGFFLSSDGGAQWAQVSSIEGASYIGVHRLFTFDDNVYAAVLWIPQVDASYAGIFISSDHGISWNKRLATGGMEGGGMNVLDLVSSGVTLFEAVSIQVGMNPSYTGVFKSNDSAKSWLPVNSGLMDSSVISLAVSGQYLFAGTSSLGVWKRPLSEMITSVQTEPRALPTEYYLSQNYPNPFNPSTNISFSLHSKSFVSLKVFDLLGKDVATIVSEELSAGNYTRQWNALNMSSGIYFYRLQTGSFTETNKLILLK